MQPLLELTLTRPWHWGIVIIGDPTGEVPTTLDTTGVAIGRNVVVIGVRHAQNIAADRFEGDWDWATATIHVRSLTEPADQDRTQVCDIVIDAVGEVISVGDADGMVSIPAPSARTRLVVAVAEPAASGACDVWVDLIAVE